jgi:hypothetical protein
MDNASDEKAKAEAMMKLGKKMTELDGQSKEIMEKAMKNKSEFSQSNPLDSYWPECFASKKALIHKNEGFASES